MSSAIQRETFPSCDLDDYSIVLVPIRIQLADRDRVSHMDKS